MSNLDAEKPLHRGIWKTTEEVQERIDELAIEIADYFDGENPLFIKLLNGGDPFSAIVMLSIAKQRPRFHPQLDEMKVSRYGQSREGSELKIVNDLMNPARGRVAVLLDDITDSGETVSKTSSHLLVVHEVESVHVAALVDRKTPEHPEPGADFIGFTFEGRDWLTGMGLDDTGIAPEANRWAGYIALANLRDE